MISALATLQSKREGGICQIEATVESIVFLICSTSSCQARWCLPAAVLQEYEGDAMFLVGLQTLLDCLQIYGTHSESAALSLSYSTDTALLQVTLEENGVLSCCDIPTLHQDLDDVPLFSEFMRQRTVCMLIFKSDQLKESLQELLDVAGAAHLKVELLQGCFRLSTASPHGRSSIEIPATSAALVSCDYSGEEASWVYPMSSFILGMRAVTLSKETCLRVNSKGILCLQHQLPAYETQVTYVDFLMLPEDESIANQ